MSGRQKKMLVRVIASVVLLAASFFMKYSFDLDSWAELAIFAVPYLVVGYDVLWSAVRNILCGQVFDEKFLMTVATAGAFGVREYPEAAAVMLFYQVGELFQSIAVGKSRRSIAALMDIRPDCAVVLRGGEETVISPDEAGIGEILVVRPGERIPLDGEILDGATSVNESALTGESVPVEKHPGDSVISGCINLNGVIKVKIKSRYEDSTVAKILELVENSAEKKAKTENFISRFAKWYTPCVVAASVLLAVVPPVVYDGDWAKWINRALVFLVVSCPCALVVSVPLSFFGCIGAASKKGILIKGSNYIESLANADTVVFDKTGTLTEGSFAVVGIHSNDISEAKLLDIAAASERYSNHPAAASIVKAHGGHIDTDRIDSIEEIAGYGIKAVIDGCTFFVGNSGLMDQCGAKWHECSLDGTIIHVSRSSDYLGHIVISDTVKPDAAEAVKQLKKIGITKTIVLTGDSEKSAEAIGTAVAANEAYGSLLPARKVEKIEEIIASGRHPIFVGDGINDAPVLSRADVGVAMGAIGSDAAIESADVVLMHDRLMCLPEAICTARKTMRIVRQNIWLALAVKAIILMLGALGAAGMWAAVFGDVGVMVLAILNAMRTLMTKCIVKATPHNSRQKRVQNYAVLP